MTVAVTFFRPATLSFGTIFTQRTNFPELNDVVKPTKSINSAAKNKEGKRKISARHHKLSSLMLVVIFENVNEAMELGKATQKPRTPRGIRGVEMLCRWASGCVFEGLHLISMQERNNFTTFPNLACLGLAGPDQETTRWTRERSRAGKRRRSWAIFEETGSDFFWFVECKAYKNICKGLSTKYVREQYSPAFSSAW